MARIAVIGGSGFIGSHTVDHLIELGHDVTVIDIAHPKRKDVVWKCVDIRDNELIKNALQANYEYVYMLAACVNVDHVKRIPVYAMEVNLGGLVNVLEACVQGKVKRILFSSTVWVYDNCTATEVDEDMSIPVYNPVHIYTASKVSGESLIRSYHHLYGLAYTIFRYGIAYGPRASDEIVLSAFIKRGFKQEPLVIYGDGSNYRNFLYVKDHARGNVLALSDRAANQIINFEGPEKVTIREVANTVNRFFKRQLQITYKQTRVADYTGKVVSNEKAKKLLGWEPSVNFHQGAKMHYEWLSRGLHHV